MWLFGPSLPLRLKERVRNDGDVCNLQMGLKFYSRLILDQWEVCMVLMSFNIKKIFYKTMIRRLNRYVLSWMQLRMQCQRRFDESDRWLGFFFPSSIIPKTGFFFC